MKTRKTLLASVLSLLALAGQTALAQYGVPGGPYGAGATSPLAYQAAYNSYSDYGYAQQASGQEPAPANAAGASMAPMGVDGCCDTCGDMGCDDCCLDPCCAAPFGCKWGLFGEFLYLRPRNADINYATPFDGPIAPGVPPVQAGRQGILDPDFSPAFRVGAHIPVDDMTEIMVTYSRFEETTNDAITVNAPNVIRSPIVHPGSLAANTDYLDASAAASINWQFIDVDYRHIFYCTPRTRINYLAGFRGAEFEQRLDSTFINVGTTDTVNTDIDFYGAGMRLGLEALRMHANDRLFVYGNGHLSLVAGEFRADYLQTSTADPVVAQTSYSAGRIIPMLDLELGVGWMSRCKNVQIRGGYLVSSWYNVVRTDQWMSGVGDNNMQDLSRALSFDGLTARVTFLW
jgi:hypothetical protein